jgi:molybdate transport system substrate-binding protein
MSKGGFDELLSSGKVAAGAVVDIATVQLGVAVRVGEPKPDISSVAAFRHALLAASSVASDSTAALYLEDVLLPKLGIAAQIKPKFVDIGPPSIAIKKVELVIDPISAVANTPGADYVGALPAQIQFSQIFSAAVLSGSREQQASRRLVTFLQTKAAHAAIAGSGMQPIE